jgi:phytoene desaturase
VRIFSILGGGMSKKKVIVIGAGPGGLTAAMILAHRGLEVSVFEAQSEVGGRNAPLRLGKYLFDTGPTFLMMDFILKDVFRLAGRKVEDYMSFRQLETLYDLKFQDMEFHNLFDADRMRAEIRKHFPGRETGLDTFFRKEAKRYEMLFPCLQKDYSTFKEMFAKPILRALPYLGLFSTMFSTLGRYFHNERLQLAFTFQAKYLGMSAWECPAIFTMIPYIEHSYGIFHVTGGLHKISEAMARVVREEGGAIHLDTPVRALVLDGKRVKGVRLENGETHYADAVVVNADFAYAMANLVAPGVLKKYSPRKLRKKEYSCSTFMMYLGVDTRYPLAHHTVVFARDYKRNVGEIFHRKVLSDDMSLYVQNACVTDPTLAPEGKSCIYILVPVPNLSGNVDWEKEKAPFRNKVLATLMQHTPLKDLDRHIEEEKIITPSDWEQQYRIYYGATFNLSHKISQLLYFRPRNRFEELKDCYLVGGGTHPGSGLPTIYASARISADLICKAFSIPFEQPTPLYAKETVEPEKHYAGRY